MAEPETVNGAHSDNINQQYSIIGVQGTLGTADVGGTAKTLPIGVTNQGAMYVYDLNGGGTSGGGGTSVEVVQGSIAVTAGTSIITSGSIAVIAGTVASVGTVPGVGVVTNLTSGSVRMTVGTVTVLPNLPGGSIAVTLGTVVGNIASGATDSGNPVKIGGVFQGTAGTVTDGQRVNLQTDEVGNLKVYLATKLDSTNDSISVANGSIAVIAGTIASVGTVPNVGSITNIGMLHGGTVVTTMGDLSGGTIDLLTAGTITKVEGGSIVVTAGTIGSLIPGTAATSLGKQEDGVHTSADVGVMALAVRQDAQADFGADGDYVPFSIDADGNLRTSASVNMADIPGGTIDMLSAGTISMLNAGTVSMLHAGTVDTVGTVTGVGVVTNLTSGSVRMTVGTLTVMPNIPGGTLGMLNAGTISMLNAGTISVLPNLPQGSINVTAGTVVVNSATVSVLPNLPQGSINVTAGTIRDDGRTTRNILTYGTTLAHSGAAYATLVGSAAVGAGTSCWVESISFINPVADVTCLVGFGTVLNGTSVLFKGELGTTSAVGIQKQFTHAVNGGMTNQDLVAYTSGAATVDVNISYFISA